MAEIPHLVMASRSRSTDAAHLASADLSSIADQLGIEFRLVGGNAVTLLTWAHGVSGLVPERETADADMGADAAYLADPALVPALLELGYERRDGSRFQRTVEHGGAPLDLIVDILAPSGTGKFESNQTVGDLVVDQVPGLALALARSALEVDVEVRLSDGSELSYRTPLPDLVAMLCMKVASYQGRLAARDAVDVWRLLECAYASGIRADTWPTSATGKDAGLLLHRYFGQVSGSGPADASRDTAHQARVRALVLQVVRDFGA